MGKENVEKIKKLVVQTLETKGELATIKAQLRAAVFQALEEQKTSEKPSSTIQNQRMQQVMGDPFGKLGFCLVKDFLSSCGLKQTLSMFVAESGTNEVSMDREKLVMSLGMESNAGPQNQPVLINYINQKPVKQKEKEKEQSSPKNTKMAPFASLPLSPTKKPLGQIQSPIVKKSDPLKLKEEQSFTDSFSKDYEMDYESNVSDISSVGNDSWAMTPVKPEKTNDKATAKATAKANVSDNLSSFPTPEKRKKGQEPESDNDDDFMDFNEKDEVDEDDFSLDISEDDDYNIDNLSLGESSVSFQGDDDFDVADKSATSSVNFDYVENI